MGIQHIGIGTPRLFDGTKDEEGIGCERQLVLDEFVGMFPIQQTSP